MIEGAVKKIRRALSFLWGTALALAFTLPAIALAQQAPVKADGGPAITTVFGAAIEGVAAGIVAALMWLLQKVLTAVLVLLEEVLDALTAFNVVFAPASHPAVTLGWTILRDIANSFFILILIWIALTIIFDIGKAGGKQFLFKVIVIAVLINFSLAFVSLVFGFANVFADAFFKGFPRGANGQLAVSEHIQNSIYVGSIFVATSKPDADAAKAKRDQESQLLSQRQDASTTGEKFALGEALGIQEAKAVFPLIPVLIGAGVALVGAWFFGDQIVQGADFVVSKALQLAMINLFLLIAIVAFAVVSVMLLARVILMVLLSVVSPAAFFLHALPGGLGNKYWDMWLSTLMRWAFFAPAFYFLFYISLYIMQINHQLIAQMSGGGKLLPVAIDPMQLINYLLAAGFMIASVLMAKKIAGGLADTAIHWATKALTLAVGGVATLAAGAVAPALRAAQPAVRAGQERLSRAPLGIGRALGGVIRSPDQYYAKQRQDVGEMAKKLEHASDDEVARSYRTPAGIGETAAKNKVAAAQILAQRGKLNLIQGSEKDALRLAGQYSPKFALDILKARPDLATPDSVARVGITQQQIQDRITAEQAAGNATTEEQAAMLLITEKIRTNEISKLLSDESLGNDEVKGALWRTMDASHVSQLQRERPDLMRQLTDYLGTNPAAGRAMKSQTYRFFSSSEARDIGVALPDTVIPPKSEQMRDVEQRQRPEAQRIVREEAEQQRREQQAAARLQQLQNRLQTLQTRAQNLDNRGSFEQALKLRELDIPLLEAEIQQLQNQP